MPLAHQLLALLINDTSLCASLAAELSALQADNAELKMLRQVHQLLLGNPGYSLLQLLSYWQGMHGPAQRDLLARVAASDLVRAAPGVARDNLAEARALLARLLEAQHREQPAATRLRTLLGRDRLPAEDQARVRALILELSRENPQDPLIQEAGQLIKQTKQ